MMRRWIVAWLSVGAGVLMGALAGAPGAGAADITWPVEPLTIESAGAVVHSFRVEVAREDAQRARGLMFRDRLADDGGMLFDFQQPQWVAMWMKNTLLSLDMLFISEDGRINHIVPRTTPLSTRTIGSEAPVRAVLELAGGQVERLGIAVGDRVRHPMFAATKSNQNDKK